MYRLTSFYIGAGGWAYFNVLGLSPLEAYSQAFNFVEVNSTFYEMPSLRLVKSWRTRVPIDFHFAIRCHKNITHRYSFQPMEKVFNTTETLLEICRYLHAKFLVFVTPSTFDFDSMKIRDIDNFFNSINFQKRGVRCVWEVRRSIEPIPRQLLSLMRDHNILHCVDFSKELPLLESSTVYTRLFGRGKYNIYQFTDAELSALDAKLSRQDPEEVVISFHNVKMYKDAARYKIFKQTSHFPPITKYRGKASLKHVLMEDARFPMTKEELIRDQGWKVVNLSNSENVHAWTLLALLPENYYKSIDEVMRSLRI